MFTKIFQKLRKPHAHRAGEAGRSMVEMLGVLAIIGILSIGGILTYRYAVTKYAANETVDELEKRYVTHVTQFTHGDLAAGMVLDANEFGPVTELGYPAMAKVEGGDTTLFSITLLTVPMRVCKQILRDYYHIPYAIKVGAGETVYEDEADLALCGTEDSASTKMIFIYSPNARGQGEGDGPGAETTEPEETQTCASNEIWDSSISRCREDCTGGDIWDSKYEVCREDCEASGKEWDTWTFSCVAPCPDGYERVQGVCRIKCDTNYFSRSNTCYPCSSTSPMPGMSDPFDAASCNACIDPTRATIQNSCYWCSAVNGRQVITEEDESACLGCDNTEVITISPNKFCVHKCTPGTQFSRNTSCFECANASQVTGLSLTRDLESCNACSDTKRVALSGTCYLCSQISNSAVLNDFEKTGCLGCPDKEVIEDRCLSKCKANQMRRDDYGCFDCSWTSSVATYMTGFTKDRSIEQCNACSDVKRAAIGGVCFRCDQMGNAALTSEAEKAACLACGTHEVLENTCTRPCAAGSFRADNLSCYACTTNGTSSLGATKEYSKESCLSCGTRAPINGLCYQCSALNKIVMNTEEEKSLCLGCGGKEIVDGKCMTSCTGDTFWADNLSCFACDNPSTTIAATKDYSKASCGACGTPRASVNGICYLCSTINNIAVTTAEDKAACLTCDGKEILNDKCLSKCASGSFRGDGLGCFTCTNPSTTIVSTTDFSRESCAACGTRASVNGVCYLCTALNNIPATTAEDQASCLTCPDKEIANNRCLTKCASGSFRGDGLGCFSCTSTSMNITTTMDFAIEACESCGNRKVNESGNCVLK